MFREALFQKHGIRNCFVKLDRLSDKDIQEVAPKKKLQLAPKTGSVRSNVSWLPASTSTQQNSADALSALSIYHDQNGIVPRVDKKSVKRQRAKSMFVDRTCQPNNAGQNQFTMDDLHVEFTERYSSPNRGLKPSNQRHLSEAQPQQLSDSQKIYNELRAKLAARKAIVAAGAQTTPSSPPPLPQMKPILSWDQLKALESKKYPVVQCSVESVPKNAPSMKNDAVASSSAYDKMNQAIKQFMLYVCTFLHFTVLQNID